MPGAFKTSKLVEHVLALCTQYHISIEFHNGGKEDDYSFSNNVIRLRPLINKARYAIALHEIGHLVTRTRSHPRLFQEGAAWAWARTNALCWTQSMQDAMLQGLRSYLSAFCADFDQALPSQLRAPPRTHPFWELLRNEPQVQLLLSQHLPYWTNPELLAIPWGNVLSHPERPRCENCAYWRHAITRSHADTRGKLSIGECVHALRPLGVEMTPSAALCGTSWVRAPE